MTAPAFLEWPTPAPGESMYAWQAGLCAVCGTRDVLVLDHCHVAHETRGYLCRSCNRREGIEPNLETFVRWRSGENPAAMFGWVEPMWGASELIAAYYECSDAERLATMRRGAEAAGRIG